MKIKLVWEKVDLKSGMYIVRTDKEEIDNDGYLSTIAFKVGYHVNTITTNPGMQNEKTLEHGDYCLVAMSDGCIYAIKGKKDFLNFLNGDRNYRPATTNEMIRIIKYQKSLLKAN